MAAEDAEAESVFRELQESGIAMVKHGRWGFPQERIFRLLMLEDEAHNTDRNNINSGALTKSRRTVESGACLRWVGRRGRARTIPLAAVERIELGEVPPMEGGRPRYPSNGFRWTGRPNKAGCYFTLYFVDAAAARRDVNGRAMLDLEAPSQVDRDRIVRTIQRFVPVRNNRAR